MRSQDPAPRSTRRRTRHQEDWCRHTKVSGPDVVCPLSAEPPQSVLYLLPLHHIQKVSKGRVLGVVEGQQGQRALQLRQALPALLPLLRQLRLCELQRGLRLPLADQLDQVLLLVRDQAHRLTHRLTHGTRPAGSAAARLFSQRQLKGYFPSISELVDLHF